MCAAIGAAIAIWGVITQRIIARRKATLDHLARLDSDKDLLDARETFTRLNEDPGGLSKWAEKAAFGSPELKAIRLVLNENERLAIGIQFGILDYAFVKRHSKGSIVSDWDRAAPFVSLLRARTGKPAIFYEFEDLADRLASNRRPKRSYWSRLWF